MGSRMHFSLVQSEEKQDVMYFCVTTLLSLQLASSVYITVPDHFEICC